MSNRPDFAFAPAQHVIIAAFDLRYPGRVSRCIWQAGDRTLYEVEYAAQGDIKRGEFVADELSAA